MKNVKKRWILLLIINALALFKVYDLYRPLSEKEQIKAQEENLKYYWLYEIKVSPDVPFKYEGEKIDKGTECGDLFERFVWSYKENGKEVKLALPRIKRKIEVSYWRGPLIEGDKELWETLKSRWAKSAY